MRTHNISVGDLLSQPSGTQIESEVKDVRPNQAIQCTLLRIPGGIAVLIINQVLTVPATCDRCLKEFQLDATIEDTERIFYLKEQDPEDIPDKDYDLIDKKHNSLDVTDFIAESIELAHPTPLHCQADCPGIAYDSGKIEEVNTNPFSDLQAKVN